jgi:hypothetical protein
MFPLRALSFQPSCFRFQDIGKRLLRFSAKSGTASQIRGIRNIFRVLVAAKECGYGNRSSFLS